MKTIALLLLTGICVLGCHSNKPAANPNTPPPAVQGPPP